MRQFRWMLPLLAITILLSGLGAVQATPPTPRTPPSPPRSPQASPSMEVAVEPPLRGKELPPLKAILLVGPIDGDYGDWTTQEKQNMDLAATELEANGVIVQKFGMVHEAI